MLRDTDAIANLAVKDLTKAKEFYEGILGFEPVGREGDELIVYRSGKTTFNVYCSKEAGTNRATAVTWVVGDKVHDVVQSLKVKGVTFEHYDMPGLTLERDVHVGYGMHVAWVQGSRREHPEHRQPIVVRRGRTKRGEGCSTF